MKTRIRPPRQSLHRDGNCLVLLLCLLLLAAGILWLSRLPARFQATRELRQEKAEVLARHDPALAATREKIAAELARNEDRLGQLKNVEGALDTPEGKERLAAAVRQLEASRSALAGQLAAIDARVESFFVDRQTDRAVAWGLAAKEQSAVLDASRRAVADADDLNEIHRKAMRDAADHAGGGQTAPPADRPQTPSLPESVARQAAPVAIPAPDSAADAEAEETACAFVRALAHPPALPMIRLMEGMVETPAGERLPAGDAALAHLRGMLCYADCRHEIVAVERAGEPGAPDVRVLRVAYRRLATLAGGRREDQALCLLVELAAPESGRNGWKVRRWSAPDEESNHE